MQSDVDAQNSEKLFFLLALLIWISYSVMSFIRLTKYSRAKLLRMELQPFQLE